MLRLWIWPLLAFAAMLIPGAMQAKPATARIVAVGDLHGDYDAWAAIARAAGLVDAKGRWAGGGAVLVQMGDVADRGPDSLKIIRHLMKLQREAAGRGGRVIVLVGNHEAMNMIGDLRYVHPGEYRAFADRDFESAAGTRLRGEPNGDRNRLSCSRSQHDGGGDPDAWMKTTSARQCSSIRRHGDRMARSANGWPKIRRS